MDPTSVASETRHSRRDANYLLVLLTLSLATNVILGLAVTRSAAGSQQVRRLTVGSALPSVVGTDESGRVTTIQLANQSTVLYVESRTCIWCERNAANMRALFEAKRKEYRFIGLALTPDEQLGAYSRSRGLNFTHLTAVPRDFATKHDLGGTPHLIVVSADGRVLASWEGALQGDTHKQVEAFFGISLPGLIPDAELPSQGSIAAGTKPISVERQVCLDAKGLAYSHGALLEQGSVRIACQNGSWVKLNN